MEPNTRTIQRRGDLGGVKVGMTIDENSLAHIMSIMTDLYSDPEAAVIREYSTNAWDAHVEAGQTRPIEVLLPTENSPFFVIKDYGVGLSVDDITNIYSKYGASTKRGTNDLVGMLGLGGKSALTYTNQFSVVSVKNGVKVQVSVSRVEDGTGVMEIVDTRGTTEPNGVEIRIPAKRYNHFASKARDFYRFWNPSHVLIDGAPPVSIISAEAKQISPGVYMIPGHESDQVVMGNVAYPTENKFYNTGYYSNFFVVAFVDIGAVDFVPSREALQYTTRTKATCQKISDEFKRDLVKFISNDISQAKTKPEALVALLTWTNMIARAVPDNITWNGEVVPRVFKGTFSLYNTQRHRYSVTTEHNMSFETVRNAAIVTDFPSASISPDQRTKMRRWNEAQTNQVRYFVTCDKAFGDGWLDNIPHVSWNDIKSIKIARTGATGPRSLPTYDVWDDAAGTFNSVSMPPTAGSVYYCSVVNHIPHPVFSALTKAEPTATIVMLNQNRWPKLKREYPHAKYIGVKVKEFYAGAVAALTDLDRLIINMTYWDERMVKLLDASKVDDPEVKNYITTVTTAGGKPATIKEFERWHELARQSGHYADKPSATTKSPMHKYPLVSNNSLDRNTRDDVYLYMNAKYASMKGI